MYTRDMWCKGVDRTCTSKLRMAHVAGKVKKNSFFALLCTLGQKYCKDWSKTSKEKKSSKENNRVWDDGRGWS